MKLDRRTFLQQTGLAGLAWGLTQAGLSYLDSKGRHLPWLDRHYQVLADSTPRKLALLVGINEYVNTPALKGCLTDVELQRELLIHRFGFHSNDILTLTGQQATREAIEIAFLEHLTEQAKAGDVVVFHFSGYGNQVKMPVSGVSNQVTDQWVNSLMPSDGILPTKAIPAKNDLLEETLRLLAQSLATDKLTTILDTSYTHQGQNLQGNLRIRSFPSLSQRPNPEELAFQTRLQQRLKMMGKQMGGQIPKWGTTLAAADNNQVATEIVLNGFSAGLFTYTLTQYLWQITPPSKVIITLSRTVEQIAPLIGEYQQPHLITPSSQPLFTYYLLPETATGADGVITKIEDDKTAQIQLTGLPIRLLQHYGLNSCFTLIPDANHISIVSQSRFLVQIRSKEGLKAQAKLLDELGNETIPLQIGQLLRESIRIIPRNIGLTVALDTHLERIERVDATSAFASIGAVSSVVTAGEQWADCVLAKVKTMMPTQDNSVNTSILSPNPSEELSGYGLFLAGGIPIPNTSGVATEAVKSAIERLIPQWNTLLAVKLWQLIINESSSRLKLSATLERVDKNYQPLIQRDTRGQSLTTSSLHSDSLLTKSNLFSPHDREWLPHLPIGSQIQYRLENHEDKPIYFILVGLDATGKAFVLHYLPSSPKADSAIISKTNSYPSIAPRETLIIPPTTERWSVSGLSGLTTMQIICSPEPLTQTWKILESNPELQEPKTSLLSLSNPLPLAQALLEDLHQISAVPSELTGGIADIYAFDVNAWASVNFIYQVSSFVTS